MVYLSRKYMCTETTNHSHSRNSLKILFVMLHATNEENNGDDPVL